MADISEAEERDALRAWLDADDAYDRELDQYVGIAWDEGPEVPPKILTDAAMATLRRLRESREAARKQYLALMLRR